MSPEYDIALAAPYHYGVLHAIQYGHRLWASIMGGGYRCAERS